VQILGRYTGLFEAQSASKQFRNRRGGGVITALLTYSMKKALIAEALVVRSSKKKPYAEPVIVRTLKGVKEAAGSKYTFVPYGALPEELGNHSAMVGLPCQTKRCQNKILKLGLFCGLNTSPRGLDYLLRKLGIAYDQIEDLDYRAPEGGLSVKLKDGRKIFHKSHSWLPYFFSYKKCLHCRDHTNHYADISVGDRTLDWSSVIVRTGKGKKLFLNAVKDGYIKAKPLTLQDFLSKAMITILVQKEVKGGYINTRLVRVRRVWIEHMPQYILAILGKIIYYDLKIQARAYI